MKKIIIGVLVLLIIGVGSYFYIQNSSNRVIIESDFGIKTTLPEGWVVWEGPSSSIHLIGDENFQKLILNEAQNIREKEKTYQEEIIEKINNYQDEVNSWDVESATSIYITKDNQEYQNRDLSYSGKQHSKILDSEDIFDPESVQMSFRNSPMPGDSFFDDGEKVDIIKKKIENKSVYFLRTKDHLYDVIEEVIVFYPIDTDAILDGEKIGYIFFTKIIEKGNDKEFNSFVEFISEIKIENQ